MRFVRKLTVNLRQSAPFWWINFNFSKTVADKMTLHYNEHDYSADKLTYRGEICGTVVEYNFTSFNSYSCDFL